MFNKYLRYLLTLTAWFTATLGQGVDIGMTIPAASAALDVSSRAQGVLLSLREVWQQHALGAGSLVEMDGDGPSLVDDPNSSSGTAFVQARVPNASTNISLPLRVANAGALTDAVVVASNGNVGGDALVPLSMPVSKPYALPSFAAGRRARMKAGHKAGQRFSHLLFGRGERSV